METINYYLCEAALENHEGALNLAKGNVAMALEIFENAVNILDQLRQMPCVSNWDVYRPPKCTAVEVPYLKNDRFFCYHRAMIFSHVVTDTCSIHQLAFYSGVVLQNMALAYQTMGQVLKDEKSINKSLYLYDSSLHVLGFLPVNYADSDLMRVATLNNKATILRNQFDYDGAKLALDEVRSKWRHALVLHHTTLAFVREDIEGFILNTMEAIPPTAAATA